MGRMQPALINPQMLAWARKRSRIPKEAAAKRLKVTVEQLLAFESGEAPISLSKVRECAKYYKRALAVFFLPEPPDEVDVPPDFRLLPDGSRHDISTELAHQIRRARTRQEAALEVAVALGQAAPHSVPSVRLADDPRTVAHQLRLTSNYSLDEQFAAKGSPGVFRDLRDRLESLGILVFTFSLPVVEFRGMTLYDDRVPVIVVNTKDHHGARSFSLIHELAHVALRREGACNMAEASQVEIFCNAVAGEFLVPGASLLAHPHVEMREMWDRDVVGAIARDYGVSLHVIARRLLELGQMTQDDYRPYLTFQPSTRRSSGGPSYYVATKARLGVPFISLIAEGFSRDVVSVRDVRALLGVKARKLDALMATL